MEEVLTNTRASSRGDTGSASVTKTIGVKDA